MRKIAPVFLILSTVSYADTCTMHGNIDAWAGRDSKIFGADASATECYDHLRSYRVGLSYYSDGDFLYTGLTGSFRLQYGKYISPFIGIGALVGFGEKEVNASHDGRDNNHDGYIDEDYEKDTVYAGSAFVYPEAGFSIYTGSIGFSMTARQYFGENFHGDIIYSLGVNFDGHR
jgi:hypothetical protein